MVEGHQVHRTAASHRKLLVGKRFQASSPNGRLSDGAAAVDGLVLTSVDAHGKQLFYRWTDPRSGTESERVCVHFGMSGRAAASRHPPRTPSSSLPAPTATTRLRLWSPVDGICVDVSAMTVLHGGPDVEAARRSALGADPLRGDADPEGLRARVKKSKKTIGFLLMDQAFFAGVGNIYRAEILAAARVHPDTPAATLPDAAFDRVWHYCVRMMRDGFEKGSIVTVRAGEAGADPSARRFVYNRTSCAACGSRIVSWDIAGRTAYACVGCQPAPKAAGGAPAAAVAVVPFASACAPPTAAEAAAHPASMRVPALKAALKAAGLPTVGGKAELVARLAAATTPAVKREGPPLAAPGTKGLVPADAAAAAAEKVAAGEGRHVEHVTQAAGDATADGAGAPITPAPAAKRARRGGRG